MINIIGSITISPNLDLYLLFSFYHSFQRMKMMILQNNSTCFIAGKDHRISAFCIIKKTRSFILLSFCMKSALRIIPHIPMKQAMNESIPVHWKLLFRPL